MKAIILLVISMLVFGCSESTKLDSQSCLTPSGSFGCNITLHDVYGIGIYEAREIEKLLSDNLGLDIPEVDIPEVPDIPDVDIPEVPDIPEVGNGRLDIHRSLTEEPVTLRNCDQMKIVFDRCVKNGSKSYSCSTLRHARTWGLIKVQCRKDIVLDKWNQCNPKIENRQTSQEVLTSIFVDQCVRI